MEWVETTGRTVEEAKDAALDQLGVDDTDAEFVVLTEPRPGLFGRMRGEARVRARVKPTSPRPKRGRTRRPAEQRRTKSSSRSNAGQRGAGVAVAEAGPEEGADEAESRSGSKANGSEAPRPSGQSATGTRSRRRRRSRSGGGNGGSRQTDTRQRGEGSGQGSEDRKTSVDEEGRPDMSLSFEEQGETAREFVEGLLREMGLPADVSVRTVDESTAEVAVDGSELGILIGPGGATLGALQEITRTVVQKRTGGRSERILVDVAGYRARRAEALQRFTQQIAEEVLASGSERALEPMSAADRKVVHDTVNEMSGVQTRSEGEDPRRYIVISLSNSDTGPDDG